MSHDKYAVMDRFEKKWTCNGASVTTPITAMRVEYFILIAQLENVLFWCTVTRSRETSPYFYTQGL